MFTQDKNLSFSIKMFLTFLIFLFIEIIISGFIAYQNSIADAKNYLQETTRRVNEDIKYLQGKWDTSLYTSDTNVPDVNPLYIITSDGFVIERWKPIHGFLDVSEFTRLLSYDKPETIQTITNENWRILSRPIKSDGNVVGVVTATAYKPEYNNLIELDEQLESTIEKITSELTINHDAIDVSKIDVRHLPYNITFQVVNRYNKLLIHNDNTSSISRSPSFIDSSYFDNQLRGKQEEYIIDSVTQQTYLVTTTPILNSKKTPVGIIVAGVPINTYWTFFKKYLLNSIVVSLMLLIGFFPLILLLTKKYTQDFINDTLTKRQSSMPGKIMFNKKTCFLSIDNNNIKIPYASYQYYFCKTLFSSPQKRWETDELIEKFGEQLDTKNWRKVYDTMVLLNKKTGMFLNNKLFLIEDKTYKINPQFTSKIQ